MVENKIGFIIQARLNSSRLPNKVLLPLPYGSDQTLLDQIILRAKKSSLNPAIIIATSTNPENAELAKTAFKNQVEFYQGSEEDVLGRFYEAAQKFELDTIVRLTADNPFIDAAVIDAALNAHLTQNNSYTVTTGLPLGTNIEVFSYAALSQAQQAAILPEHREHVTPYLKQHPELFRLNTLSLQNQGLGEESWRLTVDNPSDYALASLIYYLLYPTTSDFSLKQVAELIQQQPWILDINQHNFQKKIFPDLVSELKAAIILLTQNELNRAAALLAKQLN